ncbi:LysR family transcriptional regulator [Kalamiella sp. sgz302252]|uniref:LysR family transcriptional regulator n=1 Tax=Pantoea sp. sgz302252 TaxID=3341827 RepID=UPI0036D2F175
MESRSLQAFIALADTQNYREAACKIHITQPALTKKIQLLESELALQLFTRGRHGASLTPAGEQLLEKAKAVVATIADLQQLASDLSKGKAGSLAIGFGVAGIKIAPELVTNFHHVHPQVNISLDDMPSSIQKEKLLNGQLQLAFMSLPVAPPLSGLKLRTESLTLAVNRLNRRIIEDKIEQCSEYSLLAKLPFLGLTRERGPGLNRQIDRFLAFHNIQPQIQQYARDLHTLMALVAADMGVALVPESAIHIAPDEVETIPLQGPYVSWDVGIIWNPIQQDAVRDAFISMLKGSYEKN